MPTNQDQILKVFAACQLRFICRPYCRTYLLGEGNFFKALPSNTEVFINFERRLALSETIIYVLLL